LTTILKKKAQVPASRKITIKIPPQVPVNTSIEIVVSSEAPRGSEEYRQKVSLMQQARDDKQFQADLHEVIGDFKDLDAEHWPDG
jgi:hypothetical protein